jgi:predicted Fe-Mo cluster-binding NifX family protein
MVIAFPTNDKKTVAKRTGRCEEFAVYKIENNNIELLGYRENNHEHHDHSHGEGEDNHSHSHSEIMETLKDIDLLIVKMVGKHFKSDLENYSINYEKTNELDINTILNSYIN